MNTQEIAALAKNDPTIINLAVGEMDFGTAPIVLLEAAKIALNDEESARRYAPIYGLKELRELAAADFKRDGLRANLENTIIGPGAKPLLAAALYAIAKPGDEVLIPKPYYPSYLSACRVLKLKPKIIEIVYELPNANDLEGVKVVILNYPNNPTGLLYDFEKLHLDKDIWVIADEAYREIVFDRQHQWTSIGAIHKKTITIRSMSKGHNMAGWRIGYLTAYKWVIKKAVEYLGAVVGCACSISQKTAIVAMKNGAILSQAQIDNLRQRKDLVVDFFRQQGIPCTDPAGGLYVFADISQFGLSSCEMVAFLLKNAKVAVSPGIDYGYDTHIRICFSAVSTEQLNDALNKIKGALGGLKNDKN